MTPYILGSISRLRCSRYEPRLSDIQQKCNLAFRASSRAIPRLKFTACNTHWVEARATAYRNTWKAFQKRNNPRFLPSLRLPPPLPLPPFPPPPPHSIVSPCRLPSPNVRDITEQQTPRDSHPAHHRGRRFPGGGNQPRSQRIPRGPPIGVPRSIRRSDVPPRFRNDLGTGSSHPRERRWGDPRVFGGCGASSRGGGGRGCWHGGEVGRSRPLMMPRQTWRTWYTVACQVEACSKRF